MPAYADYVNKYSVATLNRDADGILEVALTDGNGGPLKWSEACHQLAELFRDIASDVDTSVLIITGTGGHFIDGVHEGSFQFGTEVPSPAVDKIYRSGKDLLLSLLDINVPIIAAMSGNAYPHAELALLSDIVIATEDIVIKDFHYEIGVVPSDGVHIVWPMLLGANRGRYFLLTCGEITAQSALDWGLVAEVVTTESELLARAHELASLLARQPPLVRRYTREALTLELRRRLHAELGYGLALEGLASGYGNWR